MKKFALLFVSLAAVLGANSSPIRAQALSIEPLDKIVAIADDDVILQSELDRAVSNILTQYRNTPQQLPPRDALERQVLDNLVMMRLQVQRAQGSGIRVSDTDVDQAAQRVAENNKIDLRQLRASIEHDGLNYDDFRKNLKDQIMVQRLHQRIAQDRANVTDSEVDVLLASNSLKSGEVHLAHITIGLPEGASAQQIQIAKEKADSVKKQIDEGMDFTAAAIRYSNAQDALQGGDLGWRRYDEVPEAFGELIEGMKPGQVSQILRGPSGFHIMKLVEKRNDAKQVVTEYHARHIEINVNELVSSEDAQRQVRDLRHRLETNEDFTKLAKQYSQDPQTANAGGDLGWFQIDQYGTRVAEQLAQLKDNEISQPFQTDVGWHILQRLGVRQEDRTSEAKREQARNVLRNRKADEEVENFLRQLRSESFVEIRLPGAESVSGTAKPHAP